MEHVAPIIQAVAWPLLVSVLVALTYPSLRRVLESRSLHIKVGDTEVTLQDSAEAFRKQISDLQDAVNELRASAPSATPQLSAKEQPPRGRTILWVDDRPDANALESAKFKDDGYDVIRSPSTNDAIGRLSAGLQPSIIISDMGRVEDGVLISDAGLRLLKSVRESGNSVPFFFYTSSHSAQRLGQRAKDEGANGITSSPLQLSRLIEA